MSFFHFLVIKVSAPQNFQSCEFVYRTCVVTCFTCVISCKWKWGSVMQTSWAALSPSWNKLGVKTRNIDSKRTTPLASWPVELGHWLSLLPLVAPACALMLLGKEQWSSSHVSTKTSQRGTLVEVTSFQWTLDFWTVSHDYQNWHWFLPRRAHLLISPIVCSFIGLFIQ